MTKIQISDALDATTIPCASKLGSEVVHLWQRRLTVPATEVSACYGLLSPEEQQRALRFRPERSRNDFVLTRGTLRILLAQYLDISSQKIRFRYEEHGKPILEGESDLRFNVSHTEGLALMAFVRQRALGVDVENLGREIEAEQLAERFFSERERQALRHLKGRELQVAFFRCWTRKEAYLKAKGNGLSMPLHQFDVSIEAADRDALLATRPDPVEAGRWKICDVPIGPGYAAAVAIAE